MLHFIHGAKKVRESLAPCTFGTLFSTLYFWQSLAPCTFGTKSGAKRTSLFVAKGTFFVNTRHF